MYCLVARSTSQLEILFLYPNHFKLKLYQMLAYKYWPTYTALFMSEKEKQ